MTTFISMTAMLLAGVMPDGILVVLSIWPRRRIHYSMCRNRTMTRILR